MLLHLTLKSICVFIKQFFVLGPEKRSAVCDSFPIWQWAVWLGTQNQYWQKIRRNHKIQVSFFVCFLISSQKMSKVYQWLQYFLSNIMCQYFSILCLKKKKGDLSIFLPLSQGSSEAVHHNGADALGFPSGGLW